MTRRIDPVALKARDELALAPPAEAARSFPNRTFGVPPVLHLATAGLFLGFLATLGLGFRAPEMVVPLAICFIIVSAFFAVPAKWVRMGPFNRDHALGWAEFRANGIATHTGHCDAGSATVLVLLLPALIFCWGVALVTIAALS
ncbi:MAG: hypothetical protein ABIT69_08310 [Sphingomicrobium sp.]